MSPINTPELHCYKLWLNFFIANSNNDFFNGRQLTNGTDTCHPLLITRFARRHVGRAAEATSDLGNNTYLVCLLTKAFIYSVFYSHIHLLKKVFSLAHLFTCLLTMTCLFCLQLSISLLQSEYLLPPIRRIVLSA